MLIGSSTWKALAFSGAAGLLVGGVSGFTNPFHNPFKKDDDDDSSAA